MQTLDLSLRDVYPAPPEQVPLAPRPVALNRRGWWLRWLAWAGFFGLPNLILLLGFHFQQDLRDLDARGRAVTGQVDSKYLRSRGRSGTAFVVRCRYVVDGRAFAVEGEVHPEEYRTLAPGAEYALSYLPEHPETCCLGQPWPLLRARNQSTLVVAGLTGLACLVWLIVFEFLLRRELSLAREGVPVVGQVTDTGSTRVKNGTRYWVRYRVTTPDGVCRTSWHNVPHFIWSYLLHGTPVTVLVDPATPRRHCPLYAFRYATIVEDEEPG